jgi:DASS family divalent anion:Na+ symporter
MGFEQRKILGAGLGALLGILIWLPPTPVGLTPTGHAVLAILGFSAVLWVFDVLGNAVTSLLMLALFILAGVKPEHALGAFASAPFWLVLGVLFYGAAMQSTGLAKRLSFWVLSWFPPTYPGILAAFLLIGILLSFAIPSITVRTAIMLPIAWALIQSLGLPPRSRESALLLLSSLEMAMIPGLATLYGSLWGPFLVQLLQTHGYQLEWWEYARAFAVPSLLYSVLLLAGNWIALRPKQPLGMNREYARTQLAALGKMSRGEIVTTVIVLVSVLYWAGESWHHLPPFLAGMLAIGVFAAFGVLREKDFGNTVPWAFLLFLGALYGLPTVVQQNQVAEWMGGYMLPIIHSVSGNLWVLVSVVAVAMFVVKFIDPVGFLAVAVLLLPLMAALKGSGVSPVVLAAVVLLPAHPFWTSYQNIWIVLGEGITGGLAYGASHRVRLANVYAVVTILTLWLSVLYWGALGLV